MNPRASMAMRRRFRRRHAKPHSLMELSSGAPASRMSASVAAWRKADPRVYNRVNQIDQDAGQDKDGGADFRGKKEILGHKIKVKMVDSSVGIQGRSGEFTLEYKRGLVNVGEEIATLAKKYKLVEMPNNRTYIVGDKKYTSKADFNQALEEDQELAQSLLEQIYAKDMA